MRIAVLFYGRIDKAKETYENTMNAIGTQHTIDTFLSTDGSTEYIDDFIALYKPVAYTNEKITHMYNLPCYMTVTGVSIENIIPHYINKGRSFALLESHIEKTAAQYDIILSLRCDLSFNLPFDFLPVQEDTIYIPISKSGFTYNDYSFDIPSNTPDFPRRILGINDIMAYGNLSVMKRYSSILDNCINLLNSRRCLLHPECINYANLMYNNLEIERFLTEFVIVR